MRRNLKYNRKLNRLSSYNYSKVGYYFVTICTKNKISYFGKIKNGKIILSNIGRIMDHFWQEIPEHFLNVKLDEYIIMPNHVHGIIVIIKNDDKCVGNKNFCSLQKDKTKINWQAKWGKSLSSIVKGFKIGVTKWCRHNNYNNFAWQKSFHDHIIRNEESLNKIREYIIYNPVKWIEDKNNIENFIKNERKPISP